MNQTLEGYASRSRKTFFGQSILTLYKAFKVTVFTDILLLWRNTSLANTAVDSVVNATLNLARHSKTILSRRT